MDAPVPPLEAFLRDALEGFPLADRSYLVGGCVRDALLGIETRDIDLVVESPGGARELATWLHMRYPTWLSRPHELGAGYPIWQIAFLADAGAPAEFSGAELQIADTQLEMFPDPESRRRVTKYGDLAQDCRRRDFTVNMLYRRARTREILDPSGRGLEDIKAGVLRGHPDVRLEKIFEDDPLRMLRLARFHARFGWTVPDDVIASTRATASRARILSGERVRDELKKTLLCARPSAGLRLIMDTGLMEALLPELVPMKGSGQDRIYHAEGDVWTHTMLVVDNSPCEIALRLAALFHDAGKPATREEVGERVKFLGHEKISETMTRDILGRLRFESALIDEVAALVRLHLRGGDAAKWASLKPARKLLRDAGELREKLLSLIEADSRSSLGADGKPRLEHIPILRERLEEAARIPMRARPVLNGREIMELTGLPSGAKVGRLLNALTELEDEWAADGKVFDSEAAKAWIRTQIKS